jgi:hypothetical protein
MQAQTLFAALFKFHLRRWPTGKALDCRSSSCGFNSRPSRSKESSEKYRMNSYGHERTTAMKVIRTAAYEEKFPKKFPKNFQEKDPKQQSNREDKFWDEQAKKDENEKLHEKGLKQ